MTKCDFLYALCNWQDEQTDIQHIREMVFISEQHVPEELEWDDKDAHCIHILARTANGRAVATARMTADGHIGRMAVLAEYRHKGIGRTLLTHLCVEAANRGLPLVHLDAQTYAIPFYEKQGFQAQGEVFMDAGIPHRHMEKYL